MFKKIKLILQSVREYKKYAIMTPLFMVGEAAMECALPFVMSIFVDKIELLNGSMQFQDLWPYIVLWYLVFLVEEQPRLLQQV